jgi:thiol-disulfide isomerase/thioredoxin
MGRAAKPALITLALSTAAVLGYITYRFTVDGMPSSEHDHAAARASDGSASGLPNELPDFEIPDLAGNPLSIRAWPGTPLVINYWATWCVPCLREIPMLKSFQDEHPWLTVVGIAVDRRAPVEEFAVDMEFNYPVMVGQNEAVNAAASFGVDFYALPFTIFTDAEGRTLAVRTGEIHQEHLDDLVGVLEDLAAGRKTVEQARAHLADVM